MIGSAPFRGRHQNHILSISKICDFGGINCLNKMENILTLNGWCHRFSPNDLAHRTKYSRFARQATISIVISFNETDWTSGWNHNLVGASIYLLPSYENTLGKIIRAQSTA